MLIPIPIILFVVLLIFSIKSAKQKAAINTHILVRIVVLLLAIGLIFLLCYLAEGRTSVLGAMYFSAYFTGAWILYLLVEAISFFIIKQNRLASTNLIILAFFIFIAAIIILVLNAA